MEITLIQQMVKKVNVELPYYSKTNAHYYKVISETEKIVILDGYDNFYIDYGPYNISLAFEDDKKQITEEEFNEAFERISKKLIKQLNKNK